MSEMSGGDLHQDDQESAQPESEGIIYTPEQDAEVDHYMDHGFGLAEALVKAGVVNPWDTRGASSRPEQDESPKQPEQDERRAVKPKNQKRPERPLSNREKARIDVAREAVKRKPFPHGYAEEEKED